MKHYNRLAILLADTYKQVHNRMYPESLTQLTSYWVPRKSMLNKQDKMVWFGVQAFIQKWLVEEFEDSFFSYPLDHVKKLYGYSMNAQLNYGNYSDDHVIALHKLGYLPLKIEALPEGSLVNMGVPCISVTNTLPEFAWLVQWIECLLQVELWKMCNHATIGHMYYVLGKKWYDKTVDATVDVRNAFADFGMRGMSCLEEAERCSAAWLLSSNKTSTTSAIPYLDYYYDAKCFQNGIGVGAVSTEHSVMGANFALDGDERTFVKRLLTELYPNTSFSMVSDTYDYWNMVKNIIPSLKDEVLAHNGKLLVRPDSGNMVEIAVETVESLWDTFGGTYNSKGYKVLDPHIGIIYGEGCTLNNVETIWTKLEELGFAANNIVFGVGAFCFTAIFEEGKMVVNTRDTFGCAMKATDGVFGDKEIMIYKDPKTDTAKLKKSHKGLVFVEKTEDGFKYTDSLNKETYEEYTKTHKSAMVPMFIDGKILNVENFITIRERLANQ